MHRRIKVNMTPIFRKLLIVSCREKEGMSLFRMGMKTLSNIITATITASYINDKSTLLSRISLPSRAIDADDNMSMRSATVVSSSHASCMILSLWGSRRFVFHSSGFQRLHGSVFYPRRFGRLCGFVSCSGWCGVSHGFIFRSGWFMSVHRHVSHSGCFVFCSSRHGECNQYP